MLDQSFQFFCYSQFVIEIVDIISEAGQHNPSFMKRERSIQNLHRLDKPTGMTRRTCSGQGRAKVQDDASRDASMMMERCLNCIEAPLQPKDEQQNDSFARCYTNLRVASRRPYTVRFVLNAVSIFLSFCLITVEASEALPLTDDYTERLLQSTNETLTFNETLRNSTVSSFLASFVVAVVAFAVEVGRPVHFFSFC